MTPLDQLIASLETSTAAAIVVARQVAAEGGEVIGIRADYVQTAHPMGPATWCRMQHGGSTVYYHWEEPSRGPVQIGGCCTVGAVAMGCPAELVAEVAS